MFKENFFQVQNVSAGYAGKEIVHGIHFEVEPHTLTALIGPNGCGKTTLLKSMVHLIEYQGKCMLQGEELKALNVRKLAQKISYIPQRSGIHVSMSVLDVVLMGYNPVLKLLERPNKEQRRRAKDAIREVGLSESMNQDYLTLSEGQKQLVLLARTMIEDTKLLILDEPDSALDFQNRYRILNILRQMTEKSERAGILCLHDPAMALEFCQQIVVMKDGRVMDILHPQTDSLEKMGHALQNIYGNITLSRCIDRKGHSHIVLLWEGEPCGQ